MDRFDKLFQALSDPDLDDEVKYITEFFRGENKQAKEQGSPTECEGNLVSPFLMRKGYIEYYEKTMALHSKKPKGNQELYTETLRPNLHHNKSPAKIQSLQATTLREVARRLNYIHEDKILFLKTTYDAFREVGMNVLVEDDKGDCTALCLYNYLAYHENPADFFPVGTYLALLAPLMKHAKDDPSKSVLLRCDNPECVRIFPSRKAWVAAKHGKKMLSDVNDDPDILRKEGNDHFAQQKYETAGRLFSRAIACSAKISESTRIACICNRAEVNLQLERWEAAEMDAREVLLLDAGHVKARFRLTRALLHLNQISEARELVCKLQDESELKENKALDKLSCAVNKAYEEQQNGIYDYFQMGKEVSCKGRVTSFHANYASPRIKLNVTCVKKSGFAYKGCIASETLPKDTLISASKAFAFVAPPKNSSTKVKEASRLELENKIVVLLHRRPKLKEIFYSLSSGVPDESLSCESNKHDMRIDVDRIARIVATNSFATHSNEAFWAVMSDPSLRMADIQVMTGSSVWISESRFNHSCTPNCYWKCISDHMFVFTAKEIEAGEELCFSYLDPAATFTDRQEIFSNWSGSGIGFHCQCDWCCVMRDSPALRNAEEVIQSTFKAVEN